MDQLFFDGWSPILRTLVVGVLGYVALIVLLRVSGKRTLSKLNAFDFIVTVALGSTVASLLTSRDVALLQGVLALATLIGLQFVVTSAAVRWPWVRTTVTSAPSLLMHRGEYLREAMRSERVTESEIREALRQHGSASLDEVNAVILESDGSLSVLRGELGGPRTTVVDVASHEPGSSEERRS